MNRMTVERIAEENSHNLNKDQFLQLYYYVRQKPYQFLLLDGIEECFREGFTNTLLSFNEHVDKATFEKVFGSSRHGEEE